MRSRTLLLIVGCLALLLLTVPTAGLSWSNGASGGDSFGTHDWVLKEANDLAVAQGATWLDLDEALLHTDDPDTVLHDFYHHVYDIWGSRYGDAPDVIAKDYDEAVSSLSAGDVQEASTYLALASHYYADICNPLHTDQSKAEDKIHSKYETAAQRYTDEPDENDKWVKSAPVSIVAGVKAAATTAAKQAHKDYKTLVSAYSKHGFNATVKTVTARSLDRAVAGVAAMILAMDGYAPPPSTSPSPSPSPSQSPSPSPSPSQSPSPSPSPTTPAVVMSVSGWMSDTAPAKYSTVSAYCKAVDQYGSPISGATVTFTWRYKTTSPAETRTTGSDGVATCTRSIGNATAGYTVWVSMSVRWQGQYASTSASFTPHAASRAGARQATTYVYITDTGTKYHRKTCRTLTHSKHRITLAKAKKAGYKPCKVCKPPR